MAQALQELFSKQDNIRIIGTRHGEKLYESLVAREELARADDMGGYYRVPGRQPRSELCKFSVEGELDIAARYLPLTTRRDWMSKGVKNLLLKLDYHSGAAKC